jgi:hypothetical protein
MLRDARSRESVDPRMSRERPAADDQAMEIEIRVRSPEPPTGELSVEGAEPVPFEGWLELLRLLSEAVDPHSA